MTKHYQKKIKLGKANRLTKWAPFWAVVKASGPGKKKHPSELTAKRRSWRGNKLKIKSRKMGKKHLG